ncbi:ATP-binding cassette domain-containing protein [Luteimonas sp. SJ-92]|uniref:ATP-binding cassette domain-containing protein n=1 Tax=Luteimonas salinisoli TaxID=2752307 RepID=A0A853JGZ5_9GAMM|nr:ATP-binding cassette domain-containing protein [Luteimonas salinisoli]NZA27730.1 ATP-binding cassette domain-containing protein [Luteimonas salinisoli]
MVNLKSDVAKSGLQVVSVSTKGIRKRAIVKGRKTNTPLDLHRFAMIGENDRIVIGDGIEKRIWVIGEKKQLIDVSPHFSWQTKHIFAGNEVELRISELSSDSDFREYISLESFHYKGVDLSQDPSSADKPTRKGTGGRRAVLLMQIKLHSRWISAGYIEIQMPLMMAKPRHNAFSRPFSHRERAVEWKSWQKGGQSLVNRIARIARVVVNPELRGANLSSALVNAAIKFSRERWHIGGKRPLFLEISAEMLRHIDFVSGCGFHYLGDTEGNRTRLAKDLVSIKNGAKGSSGIMSLQRKYHAFFESYRDRTGLTFEDLRSRLAEVLQYEDPWKHMDLEEWLALRPVIRSPIPYYMIGLDEASDAYVREAAYTRKKNGSASPQRSIDEIHVSNLEVNSKFKIPMTQHSRLIMDGFGITTKTIRTRIIGPLSFSAAAGTVNFVAGSSGCGKSLLLASLDPRWKSKSAVKTGEVSPKRYRVGWLEQPPSEASLFEHLSNKHGPERTFDALARVGLTEALLFLKPFEMLSRGQRYRAMLADLLLGDADVWLLDEFCSDLDPFTAKIVAHKLRETVQAEGRIAFVAAANHSHFISALRPHKVLFLSTGGGSEDLTWKEYSHGILQ